MTDSAQEPSLEQTPSPPESLVHSESDVIEAEPNDTTSWNIYLTDWVQSKSIVSKTKLKFSFATPNTLSQITVIVAFSFRSIKFLQKRHDVAKVYTTHHNFYKDALRNRAGTNWFGYAMSMLVIYRGEYFR